MERTLIHIRSHNANKFVMDVIISNILEVIIMPWHTRRMNGRRSVVREVIPWYLSSGIAKVNCLAAYQAKGAASLAASYVNLVNPGTNDLITVSPPTWDISDGLIFDGINQYCDTQIVFGAVWSFAIRFTNAAVSGVPIMGGMTLAAADSLLIWPNHNASTTYFDYGNELNVGAGVASGIIIVANTKAYINGVDTGLALAGTSTNVASTVMIGTGDNYPGFVAVYAQALAIYNIGLTPTQVAALNSAMAAL